MELSVQQKFERYPSEVKTILLALREVIFAVVNEQNISCLKETLKWGEPSYVTKFGSTIRFDWKQKYPEQFAVYFNCKTSLVATFKELYGDSLKFAGNRAIVFNIHDTIPLSELKHCIALALRYHQLKQLPLLGA
ncbi:DUF1801 domain-containing protein [Psychromonas hadalis]|uniref:DUF1801 domain-containing protein n=1 Tax=Psychromonas hadalis TaxID=211669 RepID=UPI0003B4D06B|nr:DUF1801 domain-containing protein [Psychromonas hadalis]